MTSGNKMTNMDLILCEYQTKFYELLDICNKVDANVNPAYLEKEIQNFKKKWNINEL